MKKMTLREKIGQMSQFVTKTSTVTGPGGERMDIASLIRAGEVGSILSVKNPEEIRDLQRMAVDSSRLGIPILFGHDIIHGCKVIFPINLACACTWDTELIYEVGKGGVVRDETVRQQVVDSIHEFGTNELGLEWLGVRTSPIKGPAGNVEFTALWRKPE